MDIQPIVINDKTKGGIKNRSSLLKNGVKRCGVIGGSGSGKTTWLVKWWIAMIHEPIGGITLVCKNQDQHQYKAIEKYAKKNNIPYEMLEEFTMDDFESLEGDVPKLIIYDDLANTDNMNALLAVSKYGRVRHQYLAVIGQDYKSIPMQIRQNLNQYAIFPLGAPHAARAMINGLSAFVNEEQLKKAYKYIVKPKNKYSMIFIQLDGESVLMTADDELYNLKDFAQVTLKKNKYAKKNKIEETDEDSD